MKRKAVGRMDGRWLCRRKVRSISSRIYIPLHNLVLPTYILELILKSACTLVPNPHRKSGPTWGLYWHRACWLIQHFCPREISLFGSASGRAISARFATRTSPFRARRPREKYCSRSARPRNGAMCIIPLFFLCRLGRLSDCLHEAIPLRAYKIFPPRSGFRALNKIAALSVLPNGARTESGNLLESGIFRNARQLLFVQSESISTLSHL